jgi:hypothetical protein
MPSSIMKPSLPFLAAAAFVAAWLVPVSAAHAQAQSPSQSPSSGMSQPAPDLSDQKLDATAAAVQHVTVLRKGYEQRMATAAAPADKQRLAGEDNNALAKAITDQGLSVEEYNSILRVAQNDPSVRAKILQRLHPEAQ